MNREISILAFGDICLGGVYEDILAGANENIFWNNLPAITGGVDYIVANLECPFSSRGEANLSKINLRANPSFLKFLKRINLVFLANNHIFDCGIDAFEDTINGLKEHSIAWVGAGKDIETARRPFITTHSGVGIGFLAYSCLTTNGENYATVCEPGVATLSLPYLQKDIAKLKKDVDVVVVSLHWGVERSHYPTPSQVMVAHKIIDWGGDIVIGHHAHAVQGIEHYKGGIICYNLGNFVFSDIKWNIKYNNKTVTEHLIQERQNKESIGVRFTIKKYNKRVDVKMDRVYPITLDNNFIPHLIDKGNLSIDIDDVTRKLNRFTTRYRKRIDSIPDLIIQTRFCKNHYTHFYSDGPIDTYFWSARWKRILQIFRNRVNFIKGTAHSYLTRDNYANSNTSR